MEKIKLQVSIEDLTWEIFEERFREKFLSNQYCEARADEYHELRQGNSTVEQYERRFFSLRHYAGDPDNDVALTRHFIRGLRDTIAGDVRLHQPSTLALAIEKARIAEDNQSRGFSVRTGSQSQSA
jgi:hypothetical protein